MKECTLSTAASSLLTELQGFHWLPLQYVSFMSQETLAPWDDLQKLQKPQQG
jgi:hypothetical protein